MKTIKRSKRAKPKGSTKAKSVKRVAHKKSGSPLAKEVTSQDEIEDVRLSDEEAEELAWRPGYNGKPSDEEG
jgi:hypothetical protein